MNKIHDLVVKFNISLLKRIDNITEKCVITGLVIKNISNTFG